MYSCRPDWPEAAERLTRWWAGESLGRPAMMLHAPRDGATWEPLPQASTLWDQWTNPDYVIPHTRQSMHNTAFFAEACPQAWVNLGPMSEAGFFGTRIECQPATIWQESIIDDWDSFDLRFDPENEWWQITCRLVEELCEAAQGEWFVARGDLGEPADMLSYLRTPKLFCMDLIEGPHDKIRAVCEELVEYSWSFYQHFNGIVNRTMPGSASWLGVWSPGHTATLQCDFSCMISPAMFDEFFAPYIRELGSRLDHFIYHLDGFNATQHLDTILLFPGLRAIQWEPGSGASRPADPCWRPLLQRIIKAGKAIWMNVSADEIEPLLADVPAESLILSCYVASETEAKELLQDVERWSRR